MNYEEMDKKDIGIPISYYHYRLPYSSKLEDAGGRSRLQQLQP
jgi:hypothetical protein